MKTIITIIVLGISLGSFAQRSNRNLIGPIWTYHAKNKNIIGASFGLLTNERNRNTNTYGLRCELIGWGLFAPLIPSSPLSEDLTSHIRSTISSPSESVFGINISATGTMGNCNISGLNISPMGTLLNKMNGISINALISLIELGNGLIIGGFNMAYEINGIQVGVFNDSEETNGFQISVIGNKCSKLKGIQIGIWNVNQKRKLPIINWAFK